MIRFAMPVTLTTRVKGARDGDGNYTYTTVTASTTGVFAPGLSVENVNGQDQIVDQPSVSLPTGTVVGALDRLTVAGTAYEVDGTPAAWPPNPFTGWAPDYSVLVRLKAVKG